MTSLHCLSLSDMTHCAVIKKSKRIMVVTGAGISASCGIPTFRGDGQFYQTVAQEFGLPHGHSVMDVRYFREDPRPFYRVARRLYPTDCTPSPTHDFIRRLERAGKLLRDYTQNIDTLEKSAGIKRVVYCHGSFASASCTTCGASYEGREIERDIRAARVPRCMQCVGDAPVGVREWVPDENSSEESVSEGDMDRDGGGVIKPDIVFFHEDLPADFYSSLERDKEKADLLLVMGTSLSVAPVSYIPMLMADTPSILINSEPLEGVEGVFDVFVEGECDTAIWGLLSQGLNKELPPTGIDTVGRWQRKRVRGAGGRIAASPRRMSLDKFLRGSSSAPEAMGDLGRCLRMMHKAGDMGVKELKRVLKKVGGVAAQGAARRMSGWLVRETGSRTISKGEEDFRRVRRRLRDELEKGLTKGFGLRALRQLEEGRGIEGRESLYVLGSS